MPKLQTHPLVRFGKAREWGYRRTARFFRIPHATFKKLVRGFVGMSLTRAQVCERRAKGEVTAIELLEWHQKNRRDLKMAA